jgi:hypothetical protein
LAKNPHIQSGNKELFPSDWTRGQREAAISEAYRNSKVAGASQGGRVVAIRVQLSLASIPERAYGQIIMWNLLHRALKTPLHGWHDLYMQALFETDRSKISGRIRDAGQALANREHELYSIPHCAIERQAVVTAMHSLDALRGCLDLENRPAAA